MITFGIHFSFFGFLEGKEPVNDSLAATKVRELWKRAIVEDQRDYAGMTAELRKITSNDNNSNEALTAHFIIGRIELDRAQNEATGSFLTAKAALEPLAAKHPKTWQGQMAQIVSLHILQLENHHREVVSGAERALKEIDWDLFGKNAPADLTVHLKIMEDKSQLKPVPNFALRPSHFGVWNIGSLETWNGSDLFTWEGFPAKILSNLLCTERLIEVAKKYKWTNVKFDCPATIKNSVGDN